MTKPCAKCLREVKLSRSHSIPKSFFRHIMKGDSAGQLVSFSTGPEKVHLSQNTGSSPILCADCESWFNKNLDQPIFQALSKVVTSKSYNDVRKPVYLSVETNQLSKFILSVFWRASLSNNVLNRNFFPPDSVSRDIASSLFCEDDEINKKFSFSIYKLYTDIQSLPFSVVEKIILPPGVISVFNGYSEAWVFAGYGWYFAAYHPKLTTSQAVTKKCYRPSRNACKVSKYDIFRDPDILKILEAMIEKNRLGHTTIRRGS